MQHGALLRGVDLVAAEHRIASRQHASFDTELQQQADRFVRNAVLRIVEHHTGALDDHALSAPWVLGEQLAQVDVLDLLVMRLQRLPGGRLRQAVRCRHDALPFYGRRKSASSNRTRSPIWSIWMSPCGYSASVFGSVA